MEDDITKERESKRDVVPLHYRYLCWLSSRRERPSDHDLFFFFFDHHKKNKGKVWAGKVQRSKSTNMMINSINNVIKAQEKTKTKS